MQNFIDFIHFSLVLVSKHKRKKKKQMTGCSVDCHLQATAFDANGQQLHTINRCMNHEYFCFFFFLLPLDCEEKAFHFFL